MGIGGTYTWWRLCFLLVFLFPFAVKADPPVHWRLLLETTHEIRELLEDLDLGVEITDDKLEYVQRRVRILSEEPKEGRGLISYLFGEGKTHAHLFVVPYKTLQLKAADPSKHYAALLEKIGFPALNDAFGFSDKPGPAREFYLACVARERKNINKAVAPNDAITTAEGKLRSGGVILKSVSFAGAMMAGLGVGYLAYNGLSYLGLRELPVERISGAVGAGLISTVYGFQWLWPKVEKPFAKFFLGRPYYRLFDGCLNLMFSDLTTAMPTLISMATQHGDDVLPQEAAALDAIISYQVPATTDALIELADIHIQKGLMDRTGKILNEIIRRDSQSEAGQWATEIKNDLEAKRQFETALVKLKRKYVRRNVFYSTLAVAASLLGLELLHPDLLTLTKAFVLQGVGLAGARMFFSKFWRRFPEEELRQKMDVHTKKLTASFVKTLVFASKKKNATPGDKFDVKRVSIDALVALARNELPGHAGELLRKAARDALHQFDDDASMSFLILEAQAAIMAQSVSKQESPEELKAMRNQVTVQTNQCITYLEDLGKPALAP